MSVMTITKVLTPVAFVALLSLAAAPALAGQHRGEGGRSVGRSSSGSRGVVRGGGGVVVRGGGAVRGRSSYYRPYYSRPYYSRPFYTFRPRVSLGFGLWMGYPVDYYGSPYGYAYPSVDPYAYQVAPSYGYPAQPYGSPNPASAYPPSNYPPSNYPAQQRGPSAGVQRGGEQSAPGGISFEITPDNATIFVDGTYMGTAGEFGPDAQPLDLTVGRHHVEIRASGYRTMTFDADVRGGQVLPYQGTLQRN
jgi:hypothetical protein